MFFRKATDLFYSQQHVTAETLTISPFTRSFVHRFLISGPDLRIDARFSPFTSSCVHRFLISSPDLKIDVGSCLFMHSCVHRFLISGPDLGIDARFSPETASSVHRFVISGPELRITARIVVGKEEQPVCSTVVGCRQGHDATKAA